MLPEIFNFVAKIGPFYLLTLFSGYNRLESQESYVSETIGFFKKCAQNKKNMKFILGLHL